MLPPYYGKVFTCLVCGKPTKEAPNDGVFLHSKNGNYGSTVWDNEGPSKGVVAFIHDDCFVLKVKDKTILAIRKGVEKVTIYPDEIVDWDPTQVEE